MSQITSINVGGDSFNLTASQIISDMGIPGYTTTVPNSTAATGTVVFVPDTNQSSFTVEYVNNKYVLNL